MIEDMVNARSTSGQARPADSGSKLPHSTGGARLCEVDGAHHAKYVCRASAAADCAPTTFVAALRVGGVRGYGENVYTGGRNRASTCWCKEKSSTVKAGLAHFSTRFLRGFGCGDRLFGLAGLGNHAQQGLLLALRRLLRQALL